MGLVKTRRLARHSLALGVFASPGVANPRRGRIRDASSFAKASTFAEATVDESEDKEAAAC